MPITAFILLEMIGASSFARLRHQESLFPSVPLLPVPVHVWGRVVDEDGKPVVNARLDHVHQNNDVVTDAKGEFELKTDAPAFVVQRPGFQSELVQTHSLQTYRIILRKSPRAQFPVCSKSDLLNAAPGWGGTLQIPKSSAVNIRYQRPDVDYSARSLEVKSRNTQAFAWQGRGSMWSFGEPNDELVWPSIEYKEETFDLDKELLLTDARGKLANGKCWRFLGLFGETLEYHNMECEAAKTLDDLMDRACVVPSALKFQ